jgi:hypothetical protein
VERLLGLKTKDKIAWNNRNKSLRRDDKPKGYASTDNLKLDAIYNLAMKEAIFGHLDHVIAYKPGSLKIRHVTQKR